MNQLVEMMRGGGKQKTLGLSFTPTKDLSKDECEKLLNWLLMEDILQEGSLQKCISGDAVFILLDFHWTPYSTISYLVQGEKAFVVGKKGSIVVMDFEAKLKEKKRKRTKTINTKKGNVAAADEDGDEDEYNFDGSDFTRLETKNSNEIVEEDLPAVKKRKSGRAQKNPVIVDLDSDDDFQQ